MTEPEVPPTTGLVAGKYELIKMIGRGGMGSVWEGRHYQLGTRTAIKFIETEYAKSEEALKRFKNEALAAARIDSKYAIKIHDVGVQDNKPFIVMELLTGEPLDKRLERFGRLSPQDTARILQQVCRALARAHEAGIVHRDLKPENIFLVREDDDEIAKVLDFGIAKVKEPGQENVSSSTKTGAVLGTPYYMSPEQARGLRTIDHRTDLWSVGVIAFKCMTGRLPFEGESLGDLLVKICTSPIPVPSQTLPGLPPAFDAWFLRALDREPNQRFGSAAELSDALAYACGVSVRRGPMSALPTPPPFSPHSGQPSHVGTGPMSQVPSGVASMPGAQASTSQSVYSPQQAPNYNQTSAPFTASTNPPQRSSKGLVAAAIVAAMVGLGLGALGVVKLMRHDDGGTTTTATQPPIDKPATGTTVASTAPTDTAKAPPVTDTSTLPPLTPASNTATVGGGTRPSTRPTATTSKSASAPTTTATNNNPVVSLPSTATATAHPTSTAKPGTDLGPGF